MVNNGEFATYVQPGTTGSNGINWGISTMNGTGPLGTYTQTCTTQHGCALPASNAACERPPGTGSGHATICPAPATHQCLGRPRQTGITVAFAALATC